MAGIGLDLRTMPAHMMRKYADDLATTAQAVALDGWPSDAAMLSDAAAWLYGILGNREAMALWQVRARYWRTLATPEGA